MLIATSRAWATSHSAARAGSARIAATAESSGSSSRQRRQRADRSTTAGVDSPHPPPAAASAAPPHHPLGDAKQQEPPQQQQQQEHADGIPPEAVWRAQLHQLQGLVRDPRKPLVAAFVLAHCYELNSPAAQAWYRQLSAAGMNAIITERQYLERRLAAAAHALDAAWRRLQLLAEAVCDQGAVLNEEQLNKEREAVVHIRDRLAAAQASHARSTARAREAGDERYLKRSRRLGRLVTGFGGVADAALRTGLRGIAAASRINAAFRNAWAATPQAQRPPPAAAEAQRQAQLLPLLPLLPDPPAQLLAAYRKEALSFELYRDAMLQHRPPALGQPSSMGGVFWQERAAAVAAVMQAPAAAAAAATAATAQAGGAEQAPVAPLPPPPLRMQDAGWQQPAHLTARPPQSLPLLPHLTQPWVRQRTLLFQEDLQLQQQQQQEEQQAALGAELQAGENRQLWPQARRGSQRVLPPLAVLLRRAMEVDQELSARLAALPPDD